MKIVHVMIFEKFIRGYIEFLATHFDITEHRFFIIGKDYGKYDLKGLPQTTIVNNITSVIKFNANLYKADKIILHGLWNPKVIQLLNMQPWLIGKCYWMMWGGDYYNFEKESSAKKKLIKKIRHFISLFRSDFELIKEKYNTRGTLHECIAYPVQLFENTTSDENYIQSDTISILVGNSADPSNNHAESLRQIKANLTGECKVNIICPLSYGGEGWAEQVEQLGKQLFANDFNALRKFIPFDEYNTLLNKIDIAVFNHRRQQAVGNVASMLSKGKKVYLNRDSVLFNYFKSLEVEVFDINEFNLDSISESSRKQNIENMRKHFSKETYLKQLKDLFYSKP